MEYSPANVLILVPTELELGLLAPEIGRHGRVEVCGFGPIASAARSAALIAAYHPKKIILCGIAGRSSEKLRISTAYQFQQVACYGVGVGHENDFQPSGQLGWQQYAKGNVRIGDQLELAVWELANGNSIPTVGLLVSVCAASADDLDVTRVRTLYPNGVAEDMEGFGVAAAAAMADVPLTIVRGISNNAGDRNHDQWKVGESMKSVNDLVFKMVCNR